MTPEQKAQAKEILTEKVNRLKQAIEDSEAYISEVKEMVARYTSDQEISIANAMAQQKEATTEIDALTALLETL